ncbi:MAG: PIN domain-containing protein [Candidatus Diapherotrites archaeon]|uniref:PIN domain-containing protein n=1 Tax=Candidatus Iainarchaeum sp. TaxID=3101447 RepID=A0A8T3YM63_9ARCH|nr:PIN domain-containing protein [Candidatus Diapherotrites archaeon]
MYFFDTYALIEKNKGSQNYEKYSGEPVMTSVFHLYEFFYSALGEFEESKSREAMGRLGANKIEVLDRDIIEASKFRRQNRQKRLSYADCMGYILAKRIGAKFLTGDKEFRGMENVEFVK